VLVVKEAHGLAAADRNGSSDPYCIVDVQGHRHATKTISRSLNPTWNEHFELRNLAADAVFRFTVMDSDSVFEPGAMQATHDPNKLKFTAAGKLRQALKNKATKVGTTVFSAADDFLGQCQLTVATIAEMVAAGKSEVWIPLSAGDRRASVPITGELCISFEIRKVDKDQQGITQMRGAGSVDAAGLPASNPEFAAAAAAADAAAALDSKVTVGQLAFLPIEFLIEERAECYLEIIDGPKVKWLGRSVKESIAVAGEVAKAMLHIRVRHASIDIRSIFAQFKGVAKRNSGDNDPEIITRSHFDLLRAFVASGQLSYGANGAAPDMVRFERGKHSFPFDVFVPPHCPTSVETEGPQIVYKLKAECNVSMLGDVLGATEVLVVNKSATPVGRDPRPFSSSVKVVGSPLQLSVKADRDCGVPFQDVKVEVTCKNVSAVLPTTKATIELYQIYGGSFRKRISETKVKFRPPIKQGEERTTVLFFEVPEVPPSTAYMSVVCQYELKFVAKAAGRDASMAMTLVVQVRDPKQKPPTLEIDRLAKLAPSPADWSTLNACVFLKDGLKLTDVAEKFWRRHALNGDDIVVVFDPRCVTPPAALFAGSALWPADKAVAEQVAQALWQRLRPTLAVIFLLKKLALVDYTNTIVTAQRLTIDVLPQVRKQDLAKFVPLGVAHIVIDAATQWIENEKKTQKN
jgi:hypothetical protein